MAEIARAATHATDYPPAPWVLRGQANFHVLAVRSRALPPVPAGFTPLRIGGFGLVVAGWVDYQGGSILRYGELLAAVAGRWAGGDLGDRHPHVGRQPRVARRRP